MRFTAHQKSRTLRSMSELVFSGVADSLMPSALHTFNKVTKLTLSGVVSIRAISFWNSPTFLANSACVYPLALRASHITGLISAGVLIYTDEISYSNW